MTGNQAAVHAQRICNTYSMPRDVDVLEAMFDFAMSMGHSRLSPASLTLITQEVCRELKRRNGGVYLGGLA